MEEKKLGLKSVISVSVGLVILQRVVWFHSDRVQEP